jgi:integrase
MERQFADFAADTLKQYRPPIRRKATRQKLEQVLREFGQLCRTTADLTPSAIADWIVRYNGRSAITSFSLLRAFAAACRLGHAAGWLDRDPFAGRPPARWWSDGELDPPERKRHLSIDEVRRLLEVADHEAAGGSWSQIRLATLVRLLIFTGVRASEALALRTEDYDTAERCIHVRPNGRRLLKTKASRRDVAVPEALEAHLRPWLARCGSEWLFPASRRLTPWLAGSRGAKAIDQVRELGRRAGIAGVTLLALRHTYGTLAESQGFGELALQRLMGHSKRTTQRAYRHPDPEVLRVGSQFRI